MTARVGGDQVEQLAEAVDGQQLGDVRALSSSAAISASSRCSAASSAAGAISIASASPSERWVKVENSAQRLDLDVEELDADRALLGRREDVERSRRGSRTGRGPRPGRRARSPPRRGRPAVSSRSTRSPLASVKPCGRSAGSGTFSLSATALTTTTTGGSARSARRQRVERGDAQADEVRRRGQVRLVGDAAARVEAHGPRLQPRAHVGGEVARVAVVAGDDERRPARVAVGERRHAYGRSDCETNARRPRRPAWPPRDRCRDAGGGGAATWLRARRGPRCEGAGGCSRELRRRPPIIRGCLGGVGRVRADRPLIHVAGHLGGGRSGLANGHGAGADDGRAEATGPRESVVSVLDGPAREDVQAHVLHDRRVELGQDRGDEGGAVGLGEAVEMGASMTVVKYSTGSSGATGTCWRHVQRRVAEPQQALGGRRRDATCHGFRPACQVPARTARARRRGSPRPPPPRVAPPPALGDEPPPGRSAASRRVERVALVGDPVEGGGGEDARRTEPSSSSRVRSATSASTRSPSRACVSATIAGEPSTATTAPAGSRSTSAAVTRPVPQPRRARAVAAQLEPSRTSRPSPPASKPTRVHPGGGVSVAKRQRSYAIAYSKPGGCRACSSARRVVRAGSRRPLASRSRSVSTLERNTAATRPRGGRSSSRRSAS